ncbi:MAG: alginate O-acetyltransferase AlgF [Gammaproteobacteria bacterium]
MKLLQKLIAGAILLGMVGGSAAWAQDEALYDPAPPPNAAFVRVVNATGETAPISAQIAEVSFKDIAYPAASPYRIVHEGQHDASVGNKKETVTIEAGKYYTLAAIGSGGALHLAAISDTISTNPAKCGVLFYNLSDKTSASLRVPSRKVDIVGDLGSGQGKMREVNAIDVDLAVVTGDKTVAEFPKVQLKRRTHLSFVLTGSGDKLQALMVENKTERK